VRLRLRLALAALCVVGAALLALLGADVVRWPAAMRSGDVRYADSPAQPGLWRITGAFPFGAARGLLGLGDDVAYRTNLFGRRAHAQQQLAAIVLYDRSPARASAAANLAGVLGFANAVFDQPRAQIYLANSVESFRVAIGLDPGNADAKYNLELALARLKAAEQDNPAPAGSSKGRRGNAAGTGEPGTGY